MNQLTFDSGTNEQFTTLTQDSESNKLRFKEPINNQFKSQNFNLNEFCVENTTNKQFETKEYAANRYTLDSIPQFTTQNFSKNLYIDESSTTNTYNMNKFLKNKIEEVPQTSSTPSKVMVAFNQAYNIGISSPQNYEEAK